MTHLIELAAFLASISALFASSEILRRRGVRRKRRAED